MNSSLFRTDALHTLYSDHHGWLLQWLNRRLGNLGDAADLAHDTFIRVMTGQRQPTPEQSRAFLTQVAKGLVVDLHRRRLLEHAYYESLQALPEACVPSHETQMMLLQTLVAIDRALDALPPRVRETFCLSQFDGLKYSEIAARLGISLGAVRKYMFQALQACHAALDEVPAA
ncbi:sigma-70 family RNA polymerase sigma factor [Chitinasiproducens palmae]|uniref:RNA polymerase sigma-70 factor, ECF subfamily n=1 Tax=Chitinasiproducens palmae TaxID=1770053 RepID=A0A1H2PV51_9BURK|nr:sigma-70 family RNA polymerase sigma factor [Chitinasiproducens palmae]SDV51140.1 RNA polymerase sigma-70 factor, ECF subfamily [Chitinasiproducens palmae]